MEREKPAAINFAVASRRIFLRGNFYFPYFCRVPATYPRNLNVDYPGSPVVSRTIYIYANRRIIPARVAYNRQRGRVQLCVCVHLV